MRIAQKESKYFENYTIHRKLKYKHLEKYLRLFFFELYQDEKSFNEKWLFYTPHKKYLWTYAQLFFVYLSYKNV